MQILKFPILRPLHHLPVYSSAKTRHLFLNLA